MIDSIISIPNRLKFGSIFDSTTAIDAHRRVVGRSVTIVPLLFYKVFSSFGDVRYEHLFASDSFIDPTQLSSSRNMTTNVRETVWCGTFVPISVKRIDSYEAKTFLFSRNIDFLLKWYVPGVPIDECYEIDHESVICRNFRNVFSMMSLHRNLFSDLMKPIVERSEPNLVEDAISSLTPEQPNFILDYLEEVFGMGCKGADLFAILQEYMLYELNEPIRITDYLDRFRYTYPIDPITGLCLGTPSYIFGFQLRPYLGDDRELDFGKKFGYDATFNSYTNSAEEMQTRFTNNVQNANDIIEEVCSLPETDFVMDVNSDSFLVNNSSCYFGSGQMGSLAMFIRLKYIVAQHANGKRCYRVVLSKTWADEIFITLFYQDDPTPEVRYISIPWFHLGSPSLVDGNLLDFY